MLGALILTGGGSRRMGFDKAVADWGGMRSVDRAVSIATESGAAKVLTVGEERYGWDSAAESPPGAGPAAGVAAGAAALNRLGVTRALVLAVDAPTIWPEDLQPLLSAGRPGAAFANLHLPLVVWLDVLPARVDVGWSMRRLIAEMRLPLLSPPPAAVQRLRGANTPEEREALLDELTARGRPRPGP